jgi:aminoglycoside 6'-N-acetyltransferase
MSEIDFRPLRREDFAPLARWLGAPHVAKWWLSPATMDYVEEHYGPSVDGLEPTEHFVIQVDGEPAGMIQRYLLADYPAWAESVGLGDTAGIDYLIGEPAFTGKGLGSRAIKQFAAAVLYRYPEATAVVAAPQQANVASWRALERAGFERVWAGQLKSDDPSDAGPAYVYSLRRAR